MHSEKRDKRKRCGLHWHRIHAGGREAEFDNGKEGWTAVLIAPPLALVNAFAGQDDDSAALTKDAFGRNFDRLATIKRRSDPGNMFRFKQNIVPG